MSLQVPYPQYCGCIVVPCPLCSLSVAFTLKYFGNTQQHRRNGTTLDTSCTTWSLFKRCHRGLPMPAWADVNIHALQWFFICIYIAVQGDSVGMVSILGGDSVGHCEKKKVSMDMCLFLKGYWDRAVWISRPNSVRFLFVKLDGEQSLQKKVGYTRRISRSQFGCCCPYKETCRST